MKKKKKPEVCAATRRRQAMFDVNVDGMTVSLKAARALIAEVADFPDDARVRIETSGGFTYPTVLRSVVVTQPL